MNDGQLEQFDVIVLGAGAAGMMCAMTAGARGRRVLLLDHSDEVGKKILISGAGTVILPTSMYRPSVSSQIILIFANQRWRDIHNTTLSR